jgi:hypothetical protein
VLFGLCHIARSIGLTIHCGRMFRGAQWECGLVLMGRGCGSGSEGVANWGLEALGEVGRFLFRALLVKCDDGLEVHRLRIIDGC